MPSPTSGTRAALSPRSPVLDAAVVRRSDGSVAGVRCSWEAARPSPFSQAALSPFSSADNPPFSAPASAACSTAGCSAAAAGEQQRPQERRPTAARLLNCRDVLAAPCCRTSNGSTAPVPNTPTGGASAEGPAPPPSCSQLVDACCTPSSNSSSISATTSPSAGTSGGPWPQVPLAPDAVAAAVALALNGRSTLGTEPGGGGGGSGAGARAPPALQPPELPRTAANPPGAAAAGQPASPSRSPGCHHEQLQADMLPRDLKEWWVDPSELNFVRGPDGRLVELGCGASGRVLKAHLRGEAVAAKVIDIGRSPEAQQTFLAESCRLQALRHPHIVSLFGITIIKNRGVLIQEFCAGRDVFAALQRDGGQRAGGQGQRALGWRQRGRRVAYDCARALNYLHSKGFVHLDVKSSNVLLTEDGTAKLSDVGMSRRSSSPPPPPPPPDQDGASMSADELPLPGTFAWMAPEVLLGAEPTPAADIFSTGVLLWEIITGERPERGLLRMPLVPQECGQEACDLMMHCLSPDPAGRPSARQLLERLGKMRRAGAGPGAHAEFD